ncbi:hypothetical protein XA68_18136 [Ophiocordyceps unilateralis]|uniref:Major facilitator superfamily (MFS) profile domain-containing protein n=1 Tax=Ophiocordyceps unilateralis TaxID=268505 RepID=A0A2A9PIC2_OPHUN|nr:hypothetical protein XA68_18136 [Ophiocordyceps unilateralis]
MQKDRSEITIMAESDECSIPDVTKSTISHPPHDRLSEFEVTFEAGDRDDPRNWSTWYRAWIVMTVAFSAWVVVLYSTSYTSALPGLRQEFHISNLAAVMGLTAYMLGLALGSLIAPPVSELCGRRIVYLFSFCLWTLSIIPAALAQSITAILLARLFRLNTPCSRYLINYVSSH